MTLASYLCVQQTVSTAMHLSPSVFPCELYEQFATVLPQLRTEKMNRGKHVVKLEGLKITQKKKKYLREKQVQGKEFVNKP